MATLSEAILNRVARNKGSCFCDICGTTKDLQPFYRDGDIHNTSTENRGALCTRCYMDRETFLKTTFRGNR
jgi:hypothetical protein